MKDQELNYDLNQDHEPNQDDIPMELRSELVISKNKDVSIVVWRRMISIGVKIKVFCTTYFLLYDFSVTLIIPLLLS
jgi:hypothetical protein